MPIEKRWVIKPQGDPQKVDELATATGIPRVLANLLVQRGIDTYDEVSRFFSPKLSDLHDPFLMKDMEKAVRRVDEAVTRGQKIMVYGDYDVDGITRITGYFTRTSSWNGGKRGELRDRARVKVS